MFFCVSGDLERMKTELREEVSGHSSVSDVESDSDFPTEVNDVQDLYKHSRFKSSVFLNRVYFG